MGRLLRAISRPSYSPRRTPPTLASDRKRVLQAVREAFAWLEGQALLVRADARNSAWRRINRRGERLVSEAGAADYKAASLLPRKVLHPRIGDSVYFNF